MGRSKLIEIAVLGVWLLVAVLFFYKTRQPHNKELAIPESMNTDTVSVAEKGKEFELRKIILMDDGKFDLTLKDDVSSRILAELSVVMVKNARGKVLDFLNVINRPRVLLKDKKADGKWVVDIFMIYEGKEINMNDWLTQNNLIYR